jgi:MFS family permease
MARDGAASSLTTASRAAAPPGPGELSLGSPRGRLLLGGFVAAHVAHHVSNSLLNPLLPFIRDTFALSYAQSGFLVAAFGLSLGFSNAPVGVLADRVGPRPVVVIGLLLTGAVSVAVAFAGAYWQLLVLLVLMGLIAGTYHAPASALLARAFPASVRGVAMGLHITGGHFSFFAAPVVAALLLSATGTWRTPYLWFAIAPVVAGVALWYLAPRVHDRPPAGLDALAAFREVGTVVRLVGPLVSVSILFQIAFAALQAFLTLWLVDARGVPGPLAAAMFGVPQLLSMIGAPLGGYLSDRLGRRAVILLGIGALGPSLYALTVVPNELLLVPLAAIGLAGAMRNAVTEVFVMDSAPAHRRATVMGGYYMLAQELGGVAVPVLGAAAGAVGIAAAFGSTCLGLAVLSVVVLLVQRKL